MERFRAAIRRREARRSAFSTRRRSAARRRTGGRHSRDVNFASDLDYVRGIHSIRVGTAIDFNSFRSDESDNYLGTYTFESIAAFEAGRPRSYTRRIGDPNVSYVNLQGALYVQDDIRIRRNLSVTPGVRIETQNHIKGVVAGPASRRHMGAVRERQDDAARELGHLLRLAADEHLRADDPHRRVPAAGDQHRESVVSRDAAGRSPA